MTHNRDPEDGCYETCDLESLYSSASTSTPTQARQLSHMPSPMTPSLSFGSSNYSTALPIVSEGTAHQTSSTMEGHAVTTTAAQYYSPYFVMPPTTTSLNSSSMLPDLAGMNVEYGYCDVANQSGFPTPIWESMLLPQDAEPMPPATTESMWEPATSQTPIYAFAHPPQSSWEGMEQMTSLEGTEAYSLSPPTPPAAQLDGDEQKIRAPRSHRRHPGDPKKKAACPVKDCGRSFTRTADMIRHWTRIHEGGRDKRGIFCDYHPDCTRKDPSFSRKDHLRAHLRDVHYEDLPKIGVNVHLSQAERDAAKKHQPHSSSSRRGKAAAVVSSSSSQEEQLERSSSSVSGQWDRSYADSPFVPGQESPQAAEDSFCSIGNEDEIEQDTKNGQTEMNTVNPMWWRCSPCLVRVPCFPNSPDETWVCSNCHNKIEPDRQKARENAAAESTDFYSESMHM